MPAPTVRYERNSAGLEEVLLSDGVSDVMHQAADGGMAVFKSIAPRRSNRYAESAVIVGGTDPAPTPRRVARIVVEAPYVLAVEKRHHTLGRVADAIERNPIS